MNRLNPTESINHLRRVDSFSATLHRSLSNGRVSGKFIIIMFEVPKFSANSVDPDQTPHSVALDLALYCLPVTLLRGSRIK